MHGRCGVPADIARLEYKAHDVFLEGRDLDFQIDYSSYVTSRKFATDNPAIVKAVNAGYAADAAWASQNVKEAEYIVQKRAQYSEQIRDQFIERNRQYRIVPVSDKKFVAELQTAADWLTARKVLPESIKVKDHLAPDDLAVL